MNHASQPPAADAGQFAAPPEWRILEAARYLEKSYAAHRSFAILLGGCADVLRRSIDQFLVATGSAGRIVRIPGPTDSRQSFFHAILTQLGFEPFESTVDELQRLLTVILRQDSGQPPVCVVLEAASEFGPHVLQAVRDLACGTRDMARPPTFILTGGAKLDRVLKSRGMSVVAALCRHRHDVDFAHARPVAMATGGPPELVASVDGQVVRRFPLMASRVVIGRGPDCDLSLRNRFVSRQHAMVVRAADGDWLVDLNSTNGSSVNSQLVTRRRLAHEDIITIGNHRIQYLNRATGLPVPAVAHEPDQLGDTMIMRSIAPAATVAADAMQQLPDDAPHAA